MVAIMIMNCNLQFVQMIKCTNEKSGNYQKRREKQFSIEYCWCNELLISGKGTKDGDDECSRLPSSNLLRIVWY